jgi:hypothetical protein
MVEKNENPCWDLQGLVVHQSELELFVSMDLSNQVERYCSKMIIAGIKVTL